MRVRFVEIPVIDVARAERFYTTVFDVVTERTVIDGHDASVLHSAAVPSEGGGGVEVALMHGTSYVPSFDGTRVYLAVADVPACVERAVAAGSVVLHPVTAVGAETVAEISDSEGNRVALCGA